VCPSRTSAAQKTGLRRSRRDDVEDHDKKYDRPPCARGFDGERDVCVPAHAAQMTRFVPAATDMFASRTPRLSAPRTVPTNDPRKCLVNCHAKKHHLLFRPTIEFKPAAGLGLLTAALRCVRSFRRCFGMGSEEAGGKRVFRRTGWRLRGAARSVYVRLAHDPRLASRAFAFAIVLCVVGSFAVTAISGSVEHMRGITVGPPTQNCGDSKYGFVRANSCHPFSLPHKMSRVDVHPKSCGKFSATTAGFCLCDDDDDRTVIATPKGCGTEPVMCEKACAERPIIGKKLTKCGIDETAGGTSAGAETQSECQNKQHTFQKPSGRVKAVVASLAKAMGEPLGVQMPHGSRRDLYTDFAMYGRRMSAESVKEVRNFPTQHIPQTD
jgi:hypothetical protein